MQASDFIDHSLDNYYNVYLLLQKYVFNISVIFSQYLFLNCCHHQIYIVINHEKVNKESNGVLYLKKKYLLMLRDLLKQLFGSYIEDYHQCTCALEKETNQNTSINDKEEIKTEVELSSSIEEDSEDSFSAFDNLYLIQYIYDNIPQYTSQSILHFPSSVKTQYPLFFDFSMFFPWWSLSSMTIKSRLFNGSCTRNILRLIRHPSPYWIIPIVFLRII